MEFSESRTKENLMKAFAGECQARNRYTFAAELALENNLYVVKKVFDLTAAQELRHAEVYYKYLSEMEGMQIPIEASFPVNTSENVQKLLEDAVTNETNEGEELYRSFGDVALEEGFEQIAGKFYMIADVEKTHANRFQTFHQFMKEGKLFAEDVKVGWMCLNCGYIVYATRAPQNCPACDSDQGYFVRLSMAAMTTEDMVGAKEQDLGK